MSTTQKLEVWLRGPLPSIPALLQPVAHALLQAREEVAALGHDFDNQLLWQRPAGMASVGFHLQHLTGVLDRLFTYARGEALSPVQLQWLAAEGSPQIEADSFERLFQKFSNQIEKALLQLEHTDIAQLTEVRGVGRAQIPSTVIGLLFHAAEHSQRHLGQLLVTVAIVKAQSS
ncbi:MAG: DinB family protein [Runella zeae]